MKTVDVVIPTLRKPHAFVCLSNLRHMPWPINLHLVPEGRTWSEAVNLGLAETDPNNDVVLMDDDVFIEDGTFGGINDLTYGSADLFGFKLKHADGSIQHAGGIWVDNQILHRGWGKQDDPAYDRPLYCCHVTTSLIYIKRTALDVLKGMATDYPGMQFEDVDFNFRALKAGLKIMYTPGQATHLESASKKTLPKFSELMAASRTELYKRHIDSDHKFVEQLRKLPQPVMELAGMEAL